MIKKVCVTGTEMPRHLEKKMCLDLIKWARNCDSKLQIRQTILLAIFSHPRGVCLLESGSCTLPREYGYWILYPPAFIPDFMVGVGLEVDVKSTYLPNVQSENPFIHSFTPIIHSLQSFIHSCTHWAFILPICQSLCEEWEHNKKDTNFVLVELIL